MCTLLRRFVHYLIKDAHFSSGTTRHQHVHIFVKDVCSSHPNALQHPFELMDDVKMKLVSLKMTFFLAITSAEGLWELHALAIISLCIHWWSNNSEVTLWLNL